MMTFFFALFSTASAADRTLAISGVPVAYVASDTAAAEYPHLRRVLTGEVVMITETGFLEGSAHRVLARDVLTGRTTAALVAGSAVNDEVALVTDFVADRVVVIIDPTYVSRDIPLDGRCDDRARLAGWVAPELLTTITRRYLDRADLDSALLGVSRNGDVYEDFTALPPARFDDFWVGILNPDSMNEVGCVSSNPTPHP